MDVTLGNIIFIYELDPLSILKDVAEPNYLTTSAPTVLFIYSPFFGFVVIKKLDELP